MTFKFWISSSRFNYFKAVKGILDVAVAAIAEERGVTAERVRQGLTKHLKCFSEQYFAGKKPAERLPRPVVPAGVPVLLMAANANLCEIALRESEDMSDFIVDKLKEEEEIKVCAFGGGPGTELFALAKFLVDKRKKFPKSTISFTLLDEVEEWAETWSLIEGEIRSFLKGKFGKTSSWPFVIGKSFIPFDITDKKNYGSIRHLFGQDLYILSYVVSELYDDAALEGLQEVLRSMAASAKPGAKFLVIDRFEARLTERAAKILGGLGLRVSKVEQSKRNMDSDEESSDLGEQLIKEHSPRLKWNSFWIVGTKR